LPQRAAGPSRYPLDCRRDQMEGATTDDRTTAEKTATDPAETAQKSKEVDKANAELDRIDGSGGGSQEVSSTVPKATASTSVQTIPVQRGVGKWFAKAGRWMASMLTPLGRKVKKLMARIKTKLVSLTLKVLGLKKTVEQLDEGLAEKTLEARASVAALTEAKAASVDYRAAVDQLRSSVRAGSSRG
jgi:hypothetical protein